MTKLFRGLYRTTAGAYVADDAMAFNVPEAEYRAFGYEPDYDSLPWKESYVAAKSREGCSGGANKDANATIASGASLQWFFVGRFVERDVRITPQTKNAITMAAKIQSSVISAFRRLTPPTLPHVATHGSSLAQ
jgi:hypothetical protein